MKTPIFVDLNTKDNYLDSNIFNINEADSLSPYLDLNLYTPPLVLNKPYILAPRYYLLIHSPADQYLPTLKIHIHKSDESLLKNQARLLLTPSISYGINSAYKIEYWEWRPIINSSADITHKKIKTEYWYVPTLDEFYIPQYSYYLYNDYHYRYFSENYYDRPRIKSSIVPVSRSSNLIDFVEDLIETKEHNKIFAFPKEGFISFDEIINEELLNCNEETKQWTFSKKLEGSTLRRNINIVDGDINGSLVNTTINYIEPFLSEQLIIEN